MELVIGIDIGGTNTKAGILDEDGRCYEEQSFKTHENHDTFESFIDTLSTFVHSLKANQKNTSLKGIGIGAPNGNYYMGTIEDAPNLQWKGKLELVEKLKNKTGITNILLTNDANAAAIGEMTFGKAKCMNDFVVITLGTGLGSGIVANGRLLLGHDGFAGELGHVTVPGNGRPCGCGRQDCLENYASATGIVITAKEMLKSTKKDSLLRKVANGELTSRKIAEAASAGDSLALDIFEKTGEILGKALANTVAYLSPEAIFLFGGLAKAGNLISGPVKRHMEENLMNIFKGKVSVFTSALNTGANAAVLGAGALIWKGLQQKTSV